MTYFLKDCGRGVSPPAKVREDIARAVAETFATRPYIRFAVLIEPYTDGSGDDSIELIAIPDRRFGVPLVPWAATGCEEFAYDLVAALGRDVDCCLDKCERARLSHPPYAHADIQASRLRNRVRRQVSNLREGRCHDRVECTALPPHECRPRRQARCADGRAVPPRGHLGIRRQRRPNGGALGHPRRRNRVRGAAPQGLDGFGRREARSPDVCRRAWSRYKRRGCTGGGVPCEPIRRRATRRWPSRLPYRGATVATGYIRQIEKGRGRVTVPSLFTNADISITSS